MRWWAAAWLLAEVLLFWRHALWFDYAIPWDLRSYHLAHASVYSEALRQGELPLWDPYTYNGRPVQANIQAQVFYPTMALTGWLGSKLGDDWLPGLLELSVVFHVWLAGLFAYRLALGLKLGQPAALLTGTVYMLGGFFAAHGQHLGAVCVAAWLPLIVDCILRGINLRNGLILAAALCMTILAGMTPLTSIVFIAAVLLAIWKKQWAIAAPVLGSLVLAAVQIGPTLELTRLSIAAFRTDWIEARAGVPIKVLLSLVWPNAYGVFDPATYSQPYDLTFMYLYCGLLALGLALAGVSRRSALFAWIAAASCLFMEGSWERFVWLPDTLRGALYPQYAAAMLVLSLAVLAAYGLERLVRQQRRQWAAVAVCAADLILISSGRPMNAMPLAQEPGISYEHFQGNRETMARVRALVGTEWRTDTAGNTQSWATLAPVTKIASANGYDPMALKRTTQVRLGFTKGERWGAYYEVDQPDSPLLDMLSVRYLISREKLDLPWVAHEVPGFIVHENPGALPRFRLVSRTRTAASMEEVRGLLTTSEFNPREEAIVEGAHRTPGSVGTVRVLRYGLNEVELETEAEGSSYLVSSETHYPGWRAWLDGLEQPIHYTNVAFRGMDVPAGRHRILWRFDPWLLKWCAALSLAGWITWLLLWRRVSGKIPA